MQQWRKMYLWNSLVPVLEIILELHGDKTRVCLFHRRHFNCLLQVRGSLAMELRQSCTQPLIWLLSVMRITSKAELFHHKSTFSIHTNPGDTEISHLIIKRFDITWKAYHKDHIKFRILEIWLNSYFISGVRTKDENWFKFTLSYLSLSECFQINASFPGLRHSSNRQCVDNAT